MNWTMSSVVAARPLTGGLFCHFRLSRRVTVSVWPSGCSHLLAKAPSSTPFVKLEYCTRPRLVYPTSTANGVNRLRSMSKVSHVLLALEKRAMPPFCFAAALGDAAAVLLPVAAVLPPAGAVVVLPPLSS